MENASVKLQEEMDRIQRDADEALAQLEKCDPIQEARC